MALSDILARIPPLVDDAKIVRMPSQQRAKADPASPGQSHPDLGVALDLLDRAAEAMDALQGRCEELEALLAEARKRTETELAAAQLKSSEWERRTRRLELDLYDSESELKDAESRARTAEDRAQSAERRAAVAEESTLEARNWLNSYYEKITRSFAPRSIRAA